MTGNWASSPSKKNPRTVSPGATRIDLARFAFPEPHCGDNKICAQGKSSSLSSTVFWGWYPIIRTLILHPQVLPIWLSWSPCASSDATWPIHQRNPSLPIKLLFNILSSNILISECIPN